MFKDLLIKIISFCIVPIAIFSVQRWSNSPIGSTFFWWFIQAIVLIIFGIGIYFFFESENKKSIRIISLYILWCIISTIRGIFAAEIYWDWKGLVGNSLGLLIAISAYLVSNKDVFQFILKYYIKIALPLAVFIFPFLPLGGWGWYLFPVSILLVFFPALKLKWKIVLAFVTLVAIFADITTRSHAIKFGIPIILILLFYYLRLFFNSRKFMELARHVLLILPWFLFILGVTGVFNIFKIKEYIKGEDLSKVTINSDGSKNQPLVADSRTFLYEEVLSSAVKHKYWLLGRSPARGNDTMFFGKDALELTGRMERIRNEANILNVFTWNGIIGVLLFFWVFYKASYLAIKQSNNIYIKILGLYVAFRWFYSWIEDWSSFNLNILVIWMMIGICFSKSFRKMDNLEVELWVRSIFNNKYFKVYKFYDKLKQRNSQLKINKIHSIYENS